MQLIKGFFYYWLENIKAAKESHEMVVLLILILWQFIYIGIWFVRQPDAKSEMPHLEAIEHVSIYIFSAVALLWLPFRRHESTKVDFEMEIKGLKANAKIREIRDNLGEFIRELENRTNKIGAIQLSEYEKLLINFEGRPFDLDSQDLIVKIYQFIKSNVGGAEAELFNSVTELSATDNLQNQIEKAEPLTEKGRTYMIARLSLHVRQLKAIIENYK